MRSSSASAIRSGLLTRSPVSRVEGLVSGEVERPAVVDVDAVAHRLPPGAVPVEVAVHQGDRVRWSPSAAKVTSTSLVRVRSEATCQSGPMSQLNAMACGRVEGQDATPSADAAVDAAVVDVAADVLLEHGLLDGDRQHVVLARLDPVQVGERPERLLLRKVDHDLVAHGPVGLHAHPAPLSCSSSGAARLPSASDQNWSSWRRYRSRRARRCCRPGYAPAARRARSRRP